MLRTALAPLVLALSCLVVGCSAEDGDTAVATDIAKTEALMTSVCTGGASTYSLFDVKPDVPVDYLAVRDETRNASGWDVSLREEHGTLCATATDAAACRKKVAELRRLTDVCDDADAEDGCRIYYFIATRGDDVWTADERDEVSALVGRVDIPNEAFSTAWRAKNYQANCYPGEVEPAWRAVESGYEIIVQDSDCEDDVHVRYKALVHVHANGRVEEVKRTEFSRGREPNTCIELLTR